MKQIFLILIPLLFSCKAVINDNDNFMGLDLHPPVLQNILVDNERSITIVFDEPVTMDSKDYLCEPPLEINQLITLENSLKLLFKENQKPGQVYKCRGEVTDNKGNSLSYILSYYGWNPSIPDLKINEFNPEGSGNNPDTIELIAKSDGNTAGVTIFLGTSNFYNEKFVLPDLEVDEGDFIVIHMRPEGGITEINETSDKSESGGKLSCDSAWDLWAEKDKPISGKNGIVSLYTNPYGTIIDAAPYSNRVSADSEDYHGWTAATINMIEELSYLEVWQNTEGFIRPEDSINSNGTTGTRSICRDRNSSDNNSRDDWHIVPTGEKSFGWENSDNIHSP